MKVEYWKCNNCGCIMTQPDWELDSDGNFCSFKCLKDYGDDDAS